MEFDYRELMVARFERGSPATQYDENPIGSGLRGYLIDDRHEDYLRISMFGRATGSKVMDPLCTLRVSRDGHGKRNYNDVTEELSRPMVPLRKSMASVAM